MFESRPRTTFSQASFSAMHCIACGKWSAMPIGTARDINVSLKPPAGGSMLSDAAAHRYAWSTLTQVFHHPSEMPC
jgi:hypothetical protein